ncbi:MAG: (Fe-S)-binding protein [Peptococcales bacterium]|jgi:L-lactate dehydrogenase complex protein LldE
MQASIFITCICDNFYPEVVKSMERILKKQGVTLDCPMEQTCCGQPAFNTGYWEDAKAVGKTLLDAFKDSKYVIAPSGSCVMMIKEYYPLLFKNDQKYQPLVNELSKKTYEFTQFLVDVLKVKDLNRYFPHRVTYHPSCHGTRFLGVKESVHTLLKHVKDMDYVELPHGEMCCGFGGTFSIKMPQISQAMVDEKIDHIIETQADFVTGIDMGCLMNIQGRLEKRNIKTRAIHIAQLLDEEAKL